jgi:hypothetical protein
LHTVHLYTHCFNINSRCIQTVCYNKKISTRFEYSINVPNKQELCSLTVQAQICSKKKMPCLQDVMLQHLSCVRYALPIQHMLHDEQVFIYKLLLLKCSTI